MSKVVEFKKPEKNNTGSIPAGTLYDMNKQIMQDRKPLNKLEIGTYQPKLEDWFNMEVDCYAMLLCHDRRDFTIFHMYERENPNPPALAAKELLICLTNRGEVLSIDATEDKAWEIWMKIDGKPYCYYLFKYDDAVIEV